MSVDHDANETGTGAEPAWEHGHDGADGGGAAIEPEVVDFDALNAALGALPPPGAPSSPQLADSEGRSSATYASARPHAIPATRAPVELNAPAVIVAPEEPTVPSGPPHQMTVPLTPGGGIPVAPRTGPLPHGTPQNPYANDPYVAVAQPHPQSDNINIGHTVPMANAQQPPRRPRTPTVVVRPRGPSKTKKLLVFVALLLVFVVGGTALLFFRPPPGINFGTKAKPSATPAVFPPPPPFPSTTASAPALPTTAAVTASPSASASVTAAAAATATVSVVRKVAPAPASPRVPRQ